MIAPVLLAVAATPVLLAFWVVAWLGQDLRRLVGINTGDDGTDLCHHARKVDPDFSGPDTAAHGVELVVSQPGDADQSLGGYAAGPGAVASQLLGGDENLGSDPGGEVRRREAG